MAHIRPTPDGFEVALDASETNTVRRSGQPLVEVVQGTPSISPTYHSEEAAQAFLDGYNAGVTATQEALHSACDRLKTGAEGGDWVHVDQVPELADTAKLRDWSMA